MELVRNPTMVECGGVLVELDFDRDFITWNSVPSK